MDGRQRNCAIVVSNAHHSSDPHLRCKTRRLAKATLNPHLSATGQLQGCSPAGSSTPLETEKGCTKFGPSFPQQYCQKKEAESDHVSASCVRSLESIFLFSGEFLSVVLMDMPKVASVIGLLSSDESSDSNEAMPARKKQRVRQHSSTTFQEVV